MLLLLLKSSACLATFMLFYKFCLEQTSAHTFKRFYLIIAILISIAIPFITFTDYILVEPISFVPNTTSINQPLVEAPEIIQSTNYLPTILWSIYSIGVIVFSFRFFKNLYKLLKKIKSNPKFKTERFINVLLHDLIHPHTFFNYIFLNKSKYESNLIPTEILLHEQVHAKQKHAIDLLFIEILQIIFWFNPLLYFIKKDIKLNHEFLADQAVINSGTNTKQYQQLLLAFSSNASQNQLANAINYSLIKKRFTVMKTKTSKTKIWLRSLVLLPLLTILIYSFSSYKKIEKYDTSAASDIHHTARSIEVEVLKNGTYKIDGISATKATFKSTINQLHQDITPEIRNRIINIHVNKQKVISDEEVWFIYNSFINYGFHRIVTYNQEIIRAKGNKPFAIKSSDKQNGATKKQVAEYNALAKKYNKQPQNKRIIKLKDIKRLEYLYGLMNESQKNNAQPFPNCPPPPPKPPVVKQGEPSDIPPPPPPPAPKLKEGHQVPDASKTGFIKINDKDYFYSIRDGKTKYYNRWGIEVDKQGNKLSTKQTDGRKVVEGQKITKVYKNNKVVSEFKKTWDDEEINQIPPPPEPKAPLDYVIEMAKKDATFYYNAKKISSDRAIELIKNNKSLNISSKIHNGIHVVKLQTEPITISH